MSRWVRAVSVVMAVVFLASALVQLNDPDPLTWMSVYFVASGLSVAGAARLPLATALRWVSGSLAAVSTFWGAWLIITAATLHPDWVQVLSTVQMMSPGVEETREGLGLLLVAAWCVVLSVAPLRFSRSGA